MSQFQCPKCGYSALDVATRCPRCGEPFESRFWQRPSPGPRRRRIPAGVIVVGALVVIVVVSAIQGELEVAVKPSSPRPTVSAPAPAPPSKTQPLRDSAIPAVSARPKPPAAAPLGHGRGERRYARTWVNIRARPSGKAPVVLVLKPGEPVMVDSLSQGWYRAVSDGQRLGYVDRTLVDPVPKATPR